MKFQDAEKAAASDSDEYSLGDDDEEEEEVGFWRCSPSSARLVGAVGIVVGFAVLAVFACSQEWAQSTVTLAGDQLQKAKGAMLPADSHNDPGVVGAPMLHEGEKDLGAVAPPADCWEGCGGAGKCEGHCGAGRACCRTGDMLDPPACFGAEGLPKPALPFHTCVNMSAMSAAVSIPSPPLTDVATLAAANELLTVWPAPAPAPAPDPIYAPSPLPAPVHKFYVYRAQNMNEYPLGNVNVANMDGVMWYLSNEVMPRCPKRYHISRIKRMMVTTKATPELWAKGMNFGVRYSFDAGKCTGSNIRWLGSCNLTWDKYGYVPGCNKFVSHYPYPLVDTEYPGGIWYSLPVEGRCDNPTGARDCTWSYQDAGEIEISDLEAEIPGYAYCCSGNCSNFWFGHFDKRRCQRRVAQALDAFAKKYPDMPLDMPSPDCDFTRQAYWD